MNVLDIKFYCDDLRIVISIRDYLKLLLETLWNEGESFSGKRPFGNSGWDWSMAPALIRSGIVIGTLDEDGYVTCIDEKAYNRLILDAIRSLN